VRLADLLADTITVEAGQITLPIKPSLVALPPRPIKEKCALVRRTNNHPPEDMFYKQFRANSKEKK
jgi:hypothetical protein